MKRLLLFTLTLAMLTVANVQQVRAYSTDDLTTAGWTQVTDLGSLTVSDYYFVLVDAGTSNYSVANPLPGTNEKPAYQVLIDPLADKSQLWKLSYDSANARYSIQSAVDDWYFQGGTGANQGWTDLMSNALNDNCYFTFANSDGKFSITSTISTGTASSTARRTPGSSTPGTTVCWASAATIRAKSWWRSSILPPPRVPCTSTSWANIPIF